MVKWNDLTTEQMISFNHSSLGIVFELLSKHLIDLEMVFQDFLTNLIRVYTLRKVLAVLYKFSEQFLIECLNIDEFWKCQVIVEERAKEFFDESYTFITNIHIVTSLSGYKKDSNEKNCLFQPWTSF